MLDHVEMGQPAHHLLSTFLLPFPFLLRCYQHSFSNRSSVPELSINGRFMSIYNRMAKFDNKKLIFPSWCSRHSPFSSSTNGPETRRHRQSIKCNLRAVHLSFPLPRPSDGIARHPLQPLRRTRNCVWQNNSNRFSRQLFNYNKLNMKLPLLFSTSWIEKHHGYLHRPHLLYQPLPSIYHNHRRVHNRQQNVDLSEQEFSAFSFCVGSEWQGLLQTVISPLDENISATDISKPVPRMHLQNDHNHVPMESDSSETCSLPNTN